jgi:hypothetical protein
MQGTWAVPCCRLLHRLKIQDRFQVCSHGLHNARYMGCTMLPFIASTQDSRLVPSLQPWPSQSNVHSTCSSAALWGPLGRPICRLMIQIRQLQQERV